METSILISTKKILGLDEDYTAFDLDIITHINSVFGILNQIGIGPEEGFTIVDASSKWGDFVEDPTQLNLIRTYVFLRVRLLFDPPQTSFLLEATNEQIKEYENRLSYMREHLIPIPAAPEDDYC